MQQLQHKCTGLRMGIICGHNYNTNVIVIIIIIINEYY